MLVLSMAACRPEVPLPAPGAPGAPEESTAPAPPTPVFGPIGAGRSYPAGQKVLRDLVAHGLRRVPFVTMRRDEGFFGLVVPHGSLT